MNSDQQLVMWMGVILLGLVVATTYRTEISTMLFDSNQASSATPPNNSTPIPSNFDPNASGGQLVQPGNPIVPALSPELPRMA